MSSIPAITVTSTLTQQDITRLPIHANASTIATADQAKDAYEPQEKSSALKKTIYSVIGIAALAVALKRFCPKMMAIDAANPKWTDNIKKGITKIADIAEWPFVRIKNLFSKKGANTSAPETPAA